MMLELNDLKKFTGLRTGDRLREYFGMQTEDRVAFPIESSDRGHREASLSFEQNSHRRWQNRSIRVLLNVPLQEEEEDGFINYCPEHIIIAYAAPPFAKSFHIAALQWNRRKHAVPRTPQAKTFRREIKNETMMDAAYVAEAVTCKAVFNLGIHGKTLSRQAFEQVDRFLQMPSDKQLMERVYLERLAKI
ncbi:MAG: hypothetical protein H6853_07680 [Rhodospirillales bacterium]|nr:hypothetical protein [Alphaproteobacteria bacterium]USO03400.1 MAG: hypothetical protein H6853_07680 [Rhodospirillales bacterium]